MPIILANDSTLAFGYSLADEAEERHAVFRIDFSMLKFGYPNDEALPGHRYAQWGLAYYNAYEVFGSEWIAEIRAANRVAFPNFDGHFAELRHFIFTFHDTTLEFVSKETPLPRLTDDNLLSSVMAAFKR